MAEDATEVQQDATEDQHDYNLGTRLLPKYVIGAAEFLSRKEKAKIKDQFFGVFSELTAVSPGRRDLVRWLYNNAKVEAGCIMLHIKLGVYLQLMPLVIHKILGIPNSGDMPPKCTLKERNEEFDKMRRLLDLLSQEGDEQVDKEENNVEDKGDQDGEDGDGEDGEGGKKKKKR